MSLVVSSSAVADDIDSETFRSTPAVTSESFHVEPADVGANGEWLATTVLSYARNPVAIDTSLGDSQLSSERPVTNRTMLELGGAFAFLGRFEAGVRAPLFSQSGSTSDSSAFHVPAADGFALGDLEVHGRARLLRADAVSVAAGVHLTLPTATEGQFVGSGRPSARIGALAALRATPMVTVTVNAGAIIRALSTYRNDAEVAGGAIAISQGSGFAWGAGVSVRPLANLSVTGEVFGEVVSAGDMADRSTPVDALLGLRYQLDNGLAIGIAGGRGLSSSIGTAEARGIVMLAFAPSHARGRVDPTEQPEGAPVAIHDSSKAIAHDARDKCPFEAEDIDGFEDEDGCPDPDNDGDAIVDAQDKCPDAAEVINGVDDNDGCPDQAAGTVAVKGRLSQGQAAEETFRQGRQLMKDKQYAKACAAFEQSQKLDPQFGTQFNIAGCYIEIGKLATAWTMYRELARADKNPDRRAQSADAAAAIAKRVPKLRLVAAPSPQGMQVFMNGLDALPLLGTDAPLDFGTYEFVAGAPGHKAWRKTIKIDSEGQIVNAKIQLEASK